MAEKFTVGTKGEVTATVYIWQFSLPAESLGHASLKISNGPYISWWPEARLTKSTLELFAAEPDLTPFLQMSLEADHLALGRYHDRQYEIVNQDMSSAELLWSEILTKKSRYNALDLNCSHVCYYCLEATGFFFRLGWFAGILLGLIDYPHLGRSNFQVFTPARLDALLQWAVKKVG